MFGCRFLNDKSLPLREKFTSQSSAYILSTLSRTPQKLDAVTKKLFEMFNEQGIRTVQARDTIIFDSVSRMSRNAKGGFAFYEQLYSKGVELVFLKEPHINRQKWHKLNITKKALIQKLILKHSKTFGGSSSDSEVIAIINASYFTPEGQSRLVRVHVSNNTYYKYKAELRYQD